MYCLLVKISHLTYSLKSMGAGSSEELVLQVNNGGHGDVQLTSGAPPTFWRISGAAALHPRSISGAALMHIWCISGTTLVHLWHLSGASPAFQRHQAVFPSRSLLLCCSSICRLHFILVIRLSPFHHFFFLLICQNSACSFCHDSG